MRLEEDQKGRTISFDDGRVQMIQIDFRLSFQFAEVECHTWLHIETPAWLRCKGAEILLTPEWTTSLAPVLKFFAWSVKSVGHLGFRKLAEGVVQGYLSDAKSAVSIGFSHRDLGFVVQALYDAA
jgi:hypothetical protein